MLRPLRPVLLLACCSLTGCVTLYPLAGGRNGGIDDRELQQTIAALDHKFLQQQIAKTPLGTEVHIVVDVAHRYSGTLLSADGDRVELMNCICKEIVPSARGTGQMKTSHVPFQTLPIADMTHFNILSPPPHRFASRQVREDHSNFTVDALVFMSGRSLRWTELPEPDDSSPNADLATRLAGLSPGTQVSLVDESDHRYLGIVLSATTDDVELMDCIDQETVPGPNGPTQVKTNHVPFRTFPASSIVSCETVSPTPRDFDAPEIGVNCEEYIVEEFVFRNGRRQRWGKPTRGSVSERGVALLNAE
jgi:hypothetical protein